MKPLRVLALCVAFFSILFARLSLSAAIPQTGGFCAGRYLSDLSGRYAGWLQNLSTQVQERASAITGGRRYASDPAMAQIMFTIDTKQSMASAERVAAGRLDNAVADRYPQVLATDASLADDITDLEKAGEGLGLVNLRSDDAAQVVRHLDGVEGVVKDVVSRGANFSDTKHLANMEIVLSNPSVSENYKRRLIVNAGSQDPIVSRRTGFVGEAQAIGVLHRRGEPLDGSPDPDWGVKVDFPTRRALYQNGVSSHTLFTKVDADAKADAFVTDILAVESHPNANGRKMRFSFQERDPAKETAFLAAINKAYREQRKLAAAHDWYSAPNKWSASDMEHLPWEQ